MKRTLLAVIVLSSTLGFTADKPAAPTVSDALKAKLWKAQADMGQAQLALERTAEWKNIQKSNDAVQAASAEWKAVCGSEYQPGTDSSGEPTCVEKAAVKGK